MQLNDAGRLSALIVDDEPLAREGLRMLLDEELRRRVYPSYEAGSHQSLDDLRAENSSDVC